MLYDTCNPALIVAERAALKQAGVPTSKISSTTWAAQPVRHSHSPMLQSAVLAFKNAGVTDVTSAEAGTSAASFQPGSSAAELQAAVPSVQRHRRPSEHHGCRRAEPMPTSMGLST